MLHSFLDLRQGNHMRKSSPYFGALVVWALVFGAQAAWAGTISMNTTVTSQIRGDDLMVEVVLANLGTDAAHAVQIEATALGAKTTEKGPDLLPPNEPFEIKLHLPFKAKTPGTYPVLVRVFFQDSNQYPFSSLAPGVATYEKIAASNLLIQGKAGDVEEDGEVEFKLANLSERSLKLNISIYAPREFTLSDKEFKIDLPARSKRDLNVEVKNFTALSGATYPILAVAQYEDQGMHYTASAKAMAKVTRASDPLRRWRPFLIAGAVILLALGFIWELRRRRSRKA